MEKCAEGYGLIEGPVWDSERGLLFSDVLFGGVFCLELDGAVASVFEHRRGIGGMALQRCVARRAPASMAACVRSASAFV